MCVGTIGANRYPVTVKASAEDAAADTMVGLEITGQPRLSMAGRDGVLSARAEAGKESSIPIVVNNTGTADSAFTLGIYDARNGAKLGSYATATVPANGRITVSVAAMEAAKVRQHQ